MVRKRTDFEKRTTMGPGEATITPPPVDGTSKHYVAAKGAETEEDRLKVGRALFDAIATERAKNARSRKD